MTVDDEQFIGGRFIRASGGEWLDATSPITEQVFGRERAPEGLHHYLQLKSIILPSSYVPAGWRGDQAPGVR